MQFMTVTFLAAVFALLSLAPNSEAVVLHRRGGPGAVCSTQYGVDPKCDPSLICLPSNPQFGMCLKSN
jgi:hypothetical protein